MERKPSKVDYYLLLSFGTKKTKFRQVTLLEKLRGFLSLSLSPRLQILILNSFPSFIVQQQQQ